SWSKKGKSRRTGLRADSFSGWSDPTRSEPHLQAPPGPGGGTPPRDRSRRESHRGADFTSLELFDRHRVGRHDPDERSCLTVAEMKARGWTADGRGPPP